MDLGALPIRKGRDLLGGVVRGTPYLHNPWGHDTLALLSQRAFALVHAADGRPAFDVALEVCDGRSEAAHSVVGHELPLLLRNGFVTAPGVAPWSPPAPPERVFNLWLHVTNACNLACPYCYVHKDRTPMPDHVFDRTLAALEATAAAGTADRLHVRFAGGEPMLRFPALQRFVDAATERCQRHGVRFTAAVLTNGTVVPQDAPAWLRSRGISLSISVDGVGDVQDRMRPRQSGAGSFDLLRRGLDAYQGAGIQPYALVTVGTSNLAGLPELTDFLLERRLAMRLSLVRDLEWGSGLLDDRHGPDAVPLERLSACDPDGMLAGNPLRAVQHAVGQCYDRIEAAIARDFATLRPQPRFRGSHKFCDLEPWRPIQRACGAGQSYVAIAHDGQVSPCQAALHRDGTQPLTATSLFSQAKGQAQFARFVRGVPDPTCARCPHRASCAGGCPLLLHRRDGHTDGRSPYCEVFKAVLPRLVHIAALELWLHRAGREGTHAV